jgi:hypothetical protein
VVLASLCWASSANAQSLLANGFFDKGLGNWGVASGHAAFDPARDADEHPASGSARLVAATDLTPGERVLLTTCTTVVAGRWYFLEGRLAFDAAEAGVGWAGMGVEFRSASGCTGSSVGGAIETAKWTTQQERGEWLPAAFGSYQSGMRAPGGAKSAVIYVYLSRSSNVGGPLSLHVDDVTFAGVGTPLCRGFAATIKGTSGADKIAGTPGNDVIVGLGGDDRIDGKGGIDIVCGGPGNDDLFGGSSGDYLSGDEGLDDLRAGGGNDVLVGGSDSDRLYGGKGDDILAGGPHYDLCFPGPGDDPAEGYCDAPIIFIP